MSVITGIFNLLALLYIGRAVLLAIQIARNWNALRQEPLTGAKQRLAEQAAFFLGVPPAVLVHELAHAVAVVAFGGQVVEFGYRVFWGYVVPQGSFTAAQNWFIAIAGTLGSLAFGAAIWLTLRQNPSRTGRYFGLRAFRFQIYFSLLYYPLFSIFLPIGDWRTIYDFAATPLLSGLTAAAHILVLVLFYRADRAGAFEMPAFESLAAQTRHEAVLAAAERGDPAAQLEAINALRAGGAVYGARRLLADFIKKYPNSAEGQLQLALQANAANRHIGKESAEAATQALALGLTEPEHVALAHQIVAYYHLERGDGAAAESAMNAALTPTPAYDPQTLPPPRLAELHSLRGQAMRRQGRYEAAYAETAVARQMAAELRLEPLIGKYDAELQLIEKHAGRSLAPAEVVPLPLSES